MPNQLCERVVKSCQCDDFPITNTSAELLDEPVFIGEINFVDDPPIGVLWNRRGCLRWCFSTLSQEDADQCALQQAQLCTWDGDGGDGNGGYWRDPGSPPVIRMVFHSAESSALILCGDGSTFFYTLPPSSVLSIISQADADNRAAALASRLGVRREFCPDLTKACLTSETDYGFQLSVIGAPGDETFQITSGSLPPGMSMDGNGFISGFPALSGSFAFSVRSTEETGAFLDKNLTLVVMEITSPTELPGASVGAAYSETLTQTGGEEPLSWQVTEGVLPPGLTLDETTGVISGTPTTDPDPPPDNIYEFTVTVQDEAS